MAFVRHSACRRRDGSQKDAVTLLLNVPKKNKEGESDKPSSLVIAIGTDVMRKLGWRAGSRVFVAFGEGEDEGLIQVTPASGEDIEGSYKLSVRAGVKDRESRKAQEGKMVSASVSLVGNAKMLEGIFPPHIRKLRAEYDIDDKEGVLLIDYLRDRVT